MKKKYFLIVFFIIFSLSLILYKIYKLELNNNSLVSTNNYIKNISWNTDYQKESIYKKDDEVEILFFVDDDKFGSGKIDYSKIEDKINIKEITIDDKEISKNDEINIENGVGIKVIGTTKDSGNINGDDLDIDINLTSNESKNIENIDKNITPILESNINLYLKNNTIENYLDNLVPIYGENLENISKVIIQEKSFNITKIGKEYFLGIEKNTLLAGEYNIEILDLNGNKIKTNNLINIIGNDSLIKVFDITPKSIIFDKGGNIVLQGSGFSKIVSIQLNNNTILKSENIQIISDNLVILKIPDNLEIGTYYLNIMGTDKIYEIKNIYFNIK